MAGRRPTLSLVAARSGYSVAAVSQALNGRGRLGSEARAHILKVATDLGYVVNSRAASLRTGRTRLMALQSSPWGEGQALSEAPYFHRFANAAALEAARQDWTLVILPGGVPQDRITALQLEAGLIVDPQGDENLLMSMVATGGVLVTDGRFDLPADAVPHPEAKIRMVSVDVESVLRLSLKVAAERGYERPALITSVRKDSYAEEMAIHFGEICGPERLLRVNPGQKAAAQRVSAILDQPDRPDFFIATNMDAVFGLLHVAQERDLSLPQDIGLLTTSDTPILQQMEPSVSSIDLGPEEMARRAVSIAIDLCNGSVVDQGVLPPSPRLIERRTTRRSDGLRD